jgi:hypothetical protein
MKTSEEEANTWLFKVVIIFIVAGFLLSLIPLAKAQETQKGELRVLQPTRLGAVALVAEEERQNAQSPAH